MIPVVAIALADVQDSAIAPIIVHIQRFNGCPPARRHSHDSDTLDVPGNVVAHAVHGLNRLDAHRGILRFPRRDGVDRVILD